LVTNANCSTTGLVVPLKALQDAFGGIEFVTVTTLQATSGGGYPGVPSMDILDNIVPPIGGEEQKIEWETSKISAQSTPLILNSICFPISGCQRNAIGWLSWAVTLLVFLYDSSRSPHHPLSRLRLR